MNCVGVYTGRVRYVAVSRVGVYTGRVRYVAVSRVGVYDRESYSSQV